MAQLCRPTSFMGFIQMSSSSSSSRASSGSFGSLGLTGLIGAIVAFCKTPAFVGWAGAAKSLLVGAGTSMGATICAIPAIVGGFVVGGLAGLLTRSKKVAIVAGLGGAIICGVGGGVYGAVRGYDFSKSALTNQTCTTSFNGASRKPSKTANAVLMNAARQVAGPQILRPI